VSRSLLREKGLKS